ncbi:hypothetical protein [Spirillospora albida]|nr:hypothetical protein [Spirillospora albida]
MAAASRSPLGPVLVGGLAEAAPVGAAVACAGGAILMTALYVRARR